MLSCQLYHLYLCMLFMYLYFFYALYLYCPCVGLSVVFIYFQQCCIIYLLYSLGDVFYFPALVISYLFGTYDFH